MSEERKRLLELSEKKIIKKSPAVIKKLTDEAVEELLEKHEKEEAQKNAEKVSKVLMENIGKVFSYFEIIEEEDSKNLENELFNNKLFQEEIRDFTQSVMPWIPYIGLGLAGLSVGKYIYKKYSQSQEKEEKINEQENNKPPQE